MNKTWPSRTQIISSLYPILASQLDVPDHYRTLLMQEVAMADTFHPVDSDGDLENALDKQNRDGVIDAIVAMSEEIYNSMGEWLRNRYNHAPGYVPPKFEYRFEDAEDVAVSYVEKLL